MTAPFAPRLKGANRTAMRICIVTDAWHPQVNGVVRTLDTLRRTLRAEGHRVFMLSPRHFTTVPCPSYPEIRLSLNIPFRVAAMIEGFRPDAIHIATEGPLGWAARRYCLKHGLPFTTAYHTAFPDYIAARTHLPASWFYPLFRRFHGASRGVLVATPSVRRDLAEHGFERLVPWSRGVDTDVFYPRSDAEAAGLIARVYPDTNLAALPRPIQLYVGRVAVEKNVEAFLAADVPGTKLVVGDGPALASLRQRFPAAIFTGALFGDDLATTYSLADVFVFPSRTDTFGLVLIEALACGTPVAAYPVQGPVDVLGPEGCGGGALPAGVGPAARPAACLDDDLATAIRGALAFDRDACLDLARRFSWQTVARQFVASLQGIARFAAEVRPAA